MEILFEHYWIGFLVILLANGVIIKHRFNQEIKEKPALKKGYYAILKVAMGLGSIPLIIMIIGDLGDWIQSPFEYLNPKAMNPIILSMHISSLFG